MEHCRRCQSRRNSLGSVKFGIRHISLLLPTWCGRNYSTRFDIVCRWEELWVSSACCVSREQPRFPSLPSKVVRTFGRFYIPCMQTPPKSRANSVREAISCLTSRRRLPSVFPSSCLRRRYPLETMVTALSLKHFKTYRPTKQNPESKSCQLVLLSRITTFCTG